MRCLVPFAASPLTASAVASALDVEVTSVSVAAAGRGATPPLRVDLRPINRSATDVSLRAVEYSPALNGRDAGSGSINRDIFEPKFEVVHIDVPVTPTFSGSLRGFAAPMGATAPPTAVTWRYQGTATTGNTALPFDTQAELPLP